MAGVGNEGPERGEFDPALWAILVKNGGLVVEKGIGWVQGEKSRGELPKLRAIGGVKSVWEKWAAKDHRVQTRKGRRVCKTR